MSLLHARIIVTKDHWDALVWHGVVANQYYRLQFEPRVGVQDEATLVVRDFLMNYAPLEHALPGAPACGVTSL